MEKKDRPQGPRETIKPNDADERFVRRDSEGQFTSDQVDVSRSRATEARQAAKGKEAGPAKPGHGDRGDVKRK